MGPEQTNKDTGDEDVRFGSEETPLVPQFPEASLPPSQHHHHHSLSKRERWLAVIVFTAVATLLYADQNLTAPNLSAIAKDLGLTEQEKDTKLAGSISAVFFMVGAPAAIGVGYLSGLYPRKLLFFLVVLLGEGPVIGTYWVKTYAQFFVLRALTGLSLGGCFPLVFSLLGDLYGPDERSTVSSLIAIATGAGTAIGQGIAGFCGPSLGWRAPFLIVGIPTVALAAFMLVRVREPRRGETEAVLQRADVDYDEQITWDKAKAVLRIRTNVYIVLQGLPGSLPWGVVLVYLTDYLAQDRGLSIQAATLVVLLFGLGGAAGVIAGGYYGDRLYKVQKGYLPLWMAGGVLAGIPPFLLLVNTRLQDVPMVIAALIALVGGAVASIAGPCVRAVLLNVNEPETRGVAVGLQSTLDDVGKGAGPALVAGLVAAFGRRASFNIAALCWIPCALLMAACYYTIDKDEREMQHRLASNVARQLPAGEAQALQLELFDEEAGTAPLLAAAMPASSAPEFSRPSGSPALRSQETELSSSPHRRSALKDHQERPPIGRPSLNAPPSPVEEAPVRSRTSEGDVDMRREDCEAAPRPAAPPAPPFSTPSKDVLGTPDASIPRAFASSVEQDSPATPAIRDGLLSGAVGGGMISPEGASPDRQGAVESGLGEGPSATVPRPTTGSVANGSGNEEMVLEAVPAPLIPSAAVTNGTALIANGAAEAPLAVAAVSPIADLKPRTQPLAPALPAGGPPLRSATEDIDELFAGWSR